MNMYNPAHPGVVLDQAHLTPLGISVTNASEHLKISRKHLSEIINGKKRVTADTALRIGAFTETNPQIWLNMQTNYDLWQLRDIDHHITPCSELVA
ncbi:MAG: addiction module HigA family antidote [Parasphingorhabdus sp.]|jgi:addiction module HigA family antidote